MSSPVPPEERRRRGTYRKDRARPAPQPLPSGTIPPPPPGTDAELAATWTDLARQVEFAGTYTAACETAFVLMVQSVHAATHVSGLPPYIAQRARTAAAAALEAFGLTPASSRRLSVTTSPTAPQEAPSVPLVGALKLVPR